MSNPRPQGSAFQELVVYPTFAPALAHPYTVPGTDVTYNPEFGTQGAAPLDGGTFSGKTYICYWTDHFTDTESVVSSGEAAAGSAAMNGMSGLLTCELSFILWLESAPPVLFFVAVTIEWLEASNTSGRGCANAAKAKKVSSVMQTASQLPVLTLSHAEMLTACLAAHEYHETYVIGINNGPGMKIYWAGSLYVSTLSASPFGFDYHFQAVGRLQLHLLWMTDSGQ